MSVAGDQIVVCKNLPKNSFESDSDRGFFNQLLCREGETLDDYAELFDFDPPAVKRAAFAKIRGDILRQRLAEHGEVCQLRIPRLTNFLNLAHAFRAEDSV